MRLVGTKGTEGQNSRYKSNHVIFLTLYNIDCGNVLMNGLRSVDLIGVRINRSGMTHSRG